MKLKSIILPGIAILAALSPLAYYPVTNALINSCAKDIGREQHGCIYLFWSSGDSARYLISMGPRALPAVRKQIERPGVSLNLRIYLAWVLCKMGDPSNFPTFLEGLSTNSAKSQWLALDRMKDFPAECAIHYGEILSVSGPRLHDYYWMFLERVAPVGKESKFRIREIAQTHAADKSPLTKAEQSEIAAMIKAPQPLREAQKR